MSNTETLNPLPFYMVDIDLVRDWNADDTVSVTVYSDSEFDSVVSELARQGYVVLSTQEW